MTSISLEGNGREAFQNQIFKNGLPGRPVITSTHVDQLALKSVCPSHAIGVNPVRIDLGKCNFCRLCEQQFPDNITFTQETIATNVRERLIVVEGDDTQIAVERQLVRPEVAQFQNKMLTLFLIDDDVAVRKEDKTEKSSIAITTAVNHAQGVVLSGKISEKTQDSFKIQYEALREPRLLIVAGWAALHVFESSDAFAKYRADLFVPGDGFNATTVREAIKQLFDQDTIE